MKPIYKKHYDNLRAKHPDAIFLFRTGDFYESYESDAKVVSLVCGVTLTKDSEGTPLALFPHYELDCYLPKLIRSRRRVAICDRLDEHRPFNSVNRPW